MNRFVMISLLVMLAPGPPAYGQGFIPDPTNPPAQWMRRQQAIAYAGPGAGAMIDAYGDEPTYSALSACSQFVAGQLAGWHWTGNLQRQISRPRELLWVIGRTGDAVACFAMHNGELQDADKLAAFLENPLPYVQGKSLAAGAEEVRNRRAKETQQTWIGIAIGVGVAVTALVVWRRRRQGQQGPWGAA
jgi:hypothetical protein